MRDIVVAGASLHFLDYDLRASAQQKNLQTSVSQIKTTSSSVIFLCTVYSTEYIGVCGL